MRAEMTGRSMRKRNKNEQELNHTEQGERMQRSMTIAMALAVAIFSTGCSMMAPQYTASLDNVQKLKDAGAYTAKVGNFSSAPDKDNANPISLRGSSMVSPYQESYAAYLAEALKQELDLAKRLSPNASIEITGTLLKNDVDASGMSVGTVDLQARFVVMRSGAVRYDAVKTVRSEFPSAFAAAIAIPRAVQEYPIGVQRLLGQLFADKAFVDALK